MIWVASGLAAGLLFGCASESGTEEIGSTGSTLVRKADYEGQVRYLDESVSAAPLTADELGDTTYAIPVEVRFYDQWAVAWYVLDGVAQVGDPDMAMKVWLVEEHVPISDDVVVEGGSTENPAPSGSITDVGPIASVGTSVEENPEFDNTTWQHFPFARLDWLRDVREDWESRPPAYHPGCY